MLCVVVLCVVFFVVFMLLFFDVLLLWFVLCGAVLLCLVRCVVDYVWCCVVYVRLMCVLCLC